MDDANVGAAARGADVAPAPAGSRWSSLACPLDRGRLEREGSRQLRCGICGFTGGLAEIDGRTIDDLRAVSAPQRVSAEFLLPLPALDRQLAAERYFRVVRASFPHYSRREIRRRFGTKLSKGIQYYCQAASRELGVDATVLDLGCGSGGNRGYLETLGYRRVVGVDWWSAGADVLVDAHRLPFPDRSFSLILSTAVFEHLYNPFVAISEVARLLTPGGYFVAGASFWESWHNSSRFHLTPDGWYALTMHAGLELVDLWAGWGPIPAFLSHYLPAAGGRMHEPIRDAGTVLQALVDKAVHLVAGPQNVTKLYLRASGSYQICARSAR